MLHVERAAAVVTLRLRRASAGNRINIDLAQGLCEAAEEIEHDDSVHVVIVCADGANFCLGAEPALRAAPRIDWVEAIARITRPVVAILHGAVVAEGLELALACDIRIAAAGARFSMPQVSLGRLPAYGGTQRLPRLIGRARALDMLLSGRRLDADEAHAIGLVSRLVPQHRLAHAAKTLAATLGAHGPLALRYAKEAVCKGADMTLDQGMRLEEDLYALLQTSSDRNEGVRAFLEKRQPRYRGA